MVELVELVGLVGLFELVKLGGDCEVREFREGKANVRFGILRFCRC